MVVVRDHNIASVAQEVNHTPVLWTRQMMGLEKQRRVWAARPLLPMYIRHELLDESVRRGFRVNAVNDTCDQGLHPRVAGLGVANDPNVARGNLHRKAIFRPHTLPVEVGQLADNSLATSMQQMDHGSLS